MVKITTVLRNIRTSPYIDYSKLQTGLTACCQPQRIDSGIAFNLSLSLLGELHHIPHRQEDCQHQHQHHTTHAQGENGFDQRGETFD